MGDTRGTQYLDHVLADGKVITLSFRSGETVTVREAERFTTYVTGGDYVFRVVESETTEAEISILNESFGFIEF